jgi:response regulator of citrate/malate metabolism
MASISFPTTASNMPDRTQVDSATKTAVVQTEQPASTTGTAPATTDTVQISAAAQAKILHQAGQSVNSIASALGTSVSTVDSYLGITVSVSVPLVAAPVAKSAPAATTPATAPKVDVKG